MKAVIYARYSTDMQNPDTIEVQVKKCAEYAQDRGIEIVDVFADEAISGMKSHRPEFDRFFTGVNAGKIKAVLIYDQSRFSRDIVDWFTFRRILQSNDVTLISVTQQFVGGDLNDPAVFASEGINALVNQIHVLNTRQKVKEKMQHMAKQGLHTGGRPLLGYDVGEDRRYIINEYEAKIVRLVFLMYSQGKSYKQIIATLNEKGYRTKPGSAFGTNSLNSMLNNERYVGTYTYNKIPPAKNGKRNSHAVSEDIIRIEGAMPAIVTRELWDVVQRRLRNNKHGGRNRAKVEYLLSGKVFCGKCGLAMTGTGSKNGLYSYYDCSGKKRLKNCDKNPIAKDVLEDLVVDLIVSNVLAPDKLEESAKKLFESQGTLRSKIRPEQLDIKRRIRETEKKISNINGAIAEGVYSSSTLAMLKDLEKQQLDFFQQLAEVEKTDVSTRMVYEDILGVLNAIAANPKDPEHRRTIAKYIVRIDLHDDDMVILYNPLGKATVSIPLERNTPASNDKAAGEIVPSVKGVRLAAPPG